MPKGADGKTIENWTAKAYVASSSVYYNNEIYYANSDTINTDVPGVSSKWLNSLNITEIRGKTDKLVNSDFFAILDQERNVALKYNKDGLDVAKLSEHFLSLIPNSFNNANIMESHFEAEINMAIIYGQSLAVGGSTISSENFYTAKMFQGGTLITTNTTDSVSVANTESSQNSRFGNIVDMSQNGDGLNGRMMTKKWNELISSENGKDLSNFNFNLFGFVAGMSGAQWYQLSKYNQNRTTKWVNDGAKGVFPTALNFGVNSEGKAYLNLLQGVYFANKKANSQGKTFNVPVLCWVQGEASSDKDDTVTEYYQKLDDIFNDLNSDIKALTGQTNDVQFIIYQNSSFAIYQVPSSPSYVAGNYEGVPLACLKIAREKSNVRFGTPLYPYSPSQATSDKVHLSNVGYAMMSSHFGVQSKRAVTDKSSKIVFYPSKIETFNDGTNYYVRVKFDVPVKPLVFDVTGDDGTNMKGHGSQPNMGFSILNSSTELITEVRLSADDSVILKCSQNPTGKDLTYAWTGVLGGGNLRDSQGHLIKTTFNGITYRLDNWCPFFRITI